MAERSKAPDSRIYPSIRVFWSTNVGVGSNPTSETFLLKKSIIQFDMKEKERFYPLPNRGAF